MLKKPARWKRFKRILYRGNTRHVLKIPTMLSGREIDYLYRAARDRFSNSGYIIDAGCFLGGSTLSLAGGILENVRWKSRPRFPVIHSYDLFKVEPWTIGVYFEKDIPAGSSFLEEYKRLIGHCENLVQIHEGNILAETWDNGEIEILFIDIAKHWKVNDHIVKTFFSSLVPGHSIVIQQDYLYTEWNGWIPVTMEYLADYFSIIDVISEADTGRIIETGRVLQS